MAEEQMQNLSFSPEDLAGQERKAKRQDQAGAFASWLNSMTIRPDPNLPAQLQAARASRVEDLRKNRTVNMLEQAGQTELANLVKAGTLDAKSAASQMFTLAAQERQFEQQKELAGLKAGKTYQYQALAKDLLNQGIAKTEKEALQMALSQTKAGTTVNVGPTGTPVGDPPKDTAWARDDQGNVKLDDRGVPIALPIQGTKLFDQTSKVGDQKEKVEEETIVTSGVVLGNIDKIRKRMDESFLPTTGIFGQALRNVGGTAALDIKKLIAPIQASIGFDRLQRMRDASPTGGALGQVSERELDLLMSTLSNLDQSQSEDQFLQALSQVEKRYTDIIKKFNAYPEDAMKAAGYAPISIEAAGPIGASDDDLLKKYGSGTAEPEG
tara:strand:- start:467 stop:1612 length:1146 start_codon:yes stop_codon:yes gene_type:complete